MKSLNAEQFTTLRHLLAKAKLATKEEFETNDTHADGIYRKYFDSDLEYNHSGYKEDKKLHINSSAMTLYSLTNTELKEFVSNIIGQDSNKVSAIHTLTYYEGDFAANHTDPSDYTFTVILEDNFDGGEYYFKGKEHPMKRNGDYVTHRGKVDFHEVKKVTRGTRKCLVVWWKGVDSKTLL